MDTELFRFASVRKMPKPKGKTMPQLPSGYGNLLSRLEEVGDEPQARWELAQAALETATILADPVVAESYGLLLEEMLAMEEGGLEEFVMAFEAAFGRDPADLLEDPEHLERLAAAEDVLLAATLINEELPEMEGNAEAVVRVDHLARGYVEDYDELREPGALSWVLRAPIVYPDEIAPVDLGPDPVEEEERELEYLLDAWGELSLVATNLAWHDEMVMETEPPVAPPDEPPIVVPIDTPPPGETPEEIPRRPGPPPIVVTSRLNEAAMARLSAQTMSTLEELGISLEDLEPMDILERLEHELDAAAKQMEDDPLPAGALGVESLFKEGLGIGYIFRVLRMDLRSVGSSTMGYEIGDVARLRSVVAGERLVEQPGSEGNGEGGTARFNLRRAAESVQAARSAQRPDLWEWPGYGPMVELPWGWEHNANQYTQQQARQYAGEIVSEALKLVQDEVDSLATAPALVGDGETGEIDNRQGNKNHTTIYRYVDRVDQVQLYTTGGRVALEMIVPEPAAMLLYAAAARPYPEQPAPPLTPQALLGLKEPFSPEDVTLTNYRQLALAYGLVPTPPPPAERHVWFVKSFTQIGKRKWTETDVVDALATVIPLPEGYRATAARLNFMAIQTFAKLGEVQISIGDLTLNFPTTYTTIDPFTGKSKTVDSGWDYWDSGAGYGKWIDIDLPGHAKEELPFIVQMVHSSRGAVALKVRCKRTDEAMPAWKQQVWSAVDQAYQQRLEAYRRGWNDRGVAQSEPVHFEPERAELRRLMLSLLQLKPMDFGAVAETPIPEISFADIGRLSNDSSQYERAFEWEQMHIQWFPYAWGRREGWVEQLRSKALPGLAPECQYAGAARVILPIRAGHEWEAADLMSMGRGKTGKLASRYATLVEWSFLQRPLEPGTRVEDGQPWQVRVPTPMTLPHPKSGTEDLELLEWNRNMQVPGA